MATSITGKNFNAKLGAVIRSARSMRESIQLLILFAVEHYRTTEDATYLTSIIQQTYGVKSLPSRTIQRYIQAHANVKLMKAKDGNMVFKKAAKVVIVKQLEVVWYLFDNGHQAAPDMDIFNSLQGIINRVHKAIDGNKVKDGQADEASYMLDKLNDIAVGLNLMGVLEQDQGGDAKQVALAA